MLLLNLLKWLFYEWYSEMTSLEFVDIDSQDLFHSIYETEWTLLTSGLPFDSLHLDFVCWVFCPFWVWMGINTKLSPLLIIQFLLFLQSAQTFLSFSIVLVSLLTCVPRKMIFCTICIFYGVFVCLFCFNGIFSICPWPVYTFH